MQLVNLENILIDVSQSLKEDLDIKRGTLSEFELWTESDKCTLPLAWIVYPIPVTSAPINQFSNRLIDTHNVNILFMTEQDQDSYNPETGETERTKAQQWADNLTGQFTLELQTRSAPIGSLIIESTDKSMLFRQTSGLIQGMGYNVVVSSVDNIEFCCNGS